MPDRFWFERLVFVKLDEPREGAVPQSSERAKCTSVKSRPLKSELLNTVFVLNFAFDRLAPEKLKYSMSVPELKVAPVRFAFLKTAPFAFDVSVKLAPAKLAL
jgi:hypothetical protein